jgi:serine protease Do
VQIQEVSKEAADSFGLKQAMGALVNSVEKGGPAEKAGVEPGDIIIKVDGKDIPSSASLPRIITQVRPGAKVTLTVWRNGASRDLSVVVAEMKDETPSAAQRKPQTPKEKAKPNRMGLVLADLTPEQRKEADVKGGVLVEDIPGGVRGDVRPGDIILQVISKGVTTEAKTAAQVNELLAKLEKNASVTLQLKRGENTFFSTIRLTNGE